MTVPAESPAPSTATSTATTATDTSVMASAEKADQKAPDDTSKLRTFLSILRKFIGVTDIAAVRFSLPAQLLEPIPNLEYWNYLDRPETFVSIGDSDDELGRMLEVLRFWFTKDLKYVHGKPCKPYNSTLGEFFRSSWEVEDTSPTILGTGRKSSVVDESSTENKKVKVHYITEQTSHHPPVSAYCYDCPEKGITARGFDQISAKFTGTSIRVSPGEHNHGIYIQLAQRDGEEYHLTHPVATLSGLLRGTLSVTVADTCMVRCPQTKIKVILQYHEEGWLGRNQNKVNGVIFRYDPSNDKVARLKDVPEKAVLCHVEGNWHEKLYYTLASAPKDSQLLIDLSPLRQHPKIVPPEPEQLPNESRQLWREVTEAINARQFGLATKTKQDLEERQRAKAAARQEKSKPWRPRFFTDALAPVGRPELSEEGKTAVQGLERGFYTLEHAEEELGA